MITKEKYLVYNKENDWLDMTREELDLVTSLASSPVIKFKKIITEYLSKTANRNEALERLDEIFNYYYNAVHPVVHPFCLRMNDLNNVFEILEGMEAEPQNQSPEAKFFQEAFRSKQGYRYIITELSKSEHGSWFDASGNFTRRGRGRGNDNPSATGTLLVLLIERGYLKEELIWNNDTKQEFIAKAFNVTVGKKSTSLKSKPVQLELLNFIKYHKYLPLKP